jgi:hypothetical protein
MARDLDGRPPTRAELNRSLVANAVTKPVNVLVPAAIAVAAVLTGLWWLIPAVAVPAFVALCVITYLDGDEAERVGERLRRGRGAARLEPRVDPRTLAAPIGGQLQAALDEEQRIREAIAGSELPLTEVAGEVDRLVRALESTAGRAQTLWSYLATQDPARIRARVAQLEGSGDPSAPPVAAALREQLQALDALEGQLQRFYAQMEHMVASLGTMHAQLLRMTMASQSEGESELADEARELREEVNALADGMSEVYEQAGAAQAPGPPPPPAR